MRQTPLSLATRIRRAQKVGLTFGRIYLGIKTHQALDLTGEARSRRERWKRFNRRSAHEIFETALALRGLILKGCQFMGSRADLLPAEYVEVLSALQDRVPARPYPMVREIVERELARPVEAAFAQFGETAIAAASLAQVHEARLHSGEHVAVKVQYPEIPALVRSDLGNLRALFRAVGWIERDLDLVPFVDELASQVPKELDFIHEGERSEEIAGFFAGRDDIVVPRVFWEYSSQRLLVMEYMEGIKISEVEALRRAGVDPTQVMRTLIEAYCEQIFVHGCFHADPHPGNLFVQPGAGGAGLPRIVFLDFGLTKELPDTFRKGILNFAAALLQGKPTAMTHALIDLGFSTRDGSSQSLEAIAKLLLDVATRLRHQSFLDPRVTRESGEALQRIVRDNPIVRMPTHLVLLGRVVGLLSGLGKSLDARVDMLQVILPYALGQRGKDASPAD